MVWFEKNEFSLECNQVLAEIKNAPPDGLG